MSDSDTALLPSIDLLAVVNELSEFLDTLPACPDKKAGAALLVARDRLRDLLFPSDASRVPTERIGHDRDGWDVDIVSSPHPREVKADLKKLYHHLSPSGLAWVVRNREEALGVLDEMRKRLAASAVLSNPSPLPASRLTTNSAVAPAVLGQSHHANAQAEVHAAGIAQQAVTVTVEETMPWEDERRWVKPPGRLTANILRLMLRCKDGMSLDDLMWEVYGERGTDSNKLRKALSSAVNPYLGKQRYPKKLSVEGAKVVWA